MRRSLPPVVAAAALRRASKKKPPTVRTSRVRTVGGIALADPLLDPLLQTVPDRLHVDMFATAVPPTALIAVSLSVRDLARRLPDVRNAHDDRDDSFEGMSDAACTHIVQPTGGHRNEISFACIAAEFNVTVVALHGGA